MVSNTIDMGSIPVLPVLEPISKTTQLLLIECCRHVYTRYASDSEVKNKHNTMCARISQWL